jgi:hypothetical protein
MNSWQGMASVTLVGSMPHRDRKKAIELIVQCAPEIPVWPQLSAFRQEQMMVQYLEGLPGVGDNSGDLVIRTDSPRFDSELYSFYEEYLEVEAGSRSLSESRFRMGEETGRTFFQFVQLLSQASLLCRAVKGQIVGPFTLLSGLKDQHDRALLYDERLLDVVVKHLAMKAKWQILQLQSLGLPVILFLDEPALAGFGSSAFISVSRELIHGLLTEVVDAVHAAGGLAGVHICANTDWLLAFDSGVDIINFDAYNYFDRLILYKDKIHQFLAQNKILAWGIVPTSDPQIIAHETPQSLVDRWTMFAGQLCENGVDLKDLFSHSLFTPSCGCGSLSEEMAERVLALTHGVGEIIQSQLK